MTRPSNTKPLAQVGPYSLLQKVGSGGMGSVYRAGDTRDGRTVALKLMHEHVASDPSYAERFRREAAMAALIDSPNVVRVLEFASDGGRPYIVTEFVEGPGVDTLLKAGPLPADRAAGIAAGVANALTEANRRSIVHRDIKPGNILIGGDGIPKVTDFGIATLNHSSSLTVPGMFIGTAAYAAPEQHRGEADVRSDIYSLGVVLFEMLTGSLPFQAETATGMMRQHEEAPVPIERLQGQPATLVAAVTRCLQKAPSARFQTPGELIGALTSLAPAAPAQRYSEPTLVLPAAIAAFVPEPPATEVAGGVASDPSETRLDAALVETGEHALRGAPVAGLQSKVAEAPLFRKAVLAAAAIAGVTILAMFGFRGGNADEGRTGNGGGGGGRGDYTMPITDGGKTPPALEAETPSPSPTATKTTKASPTLSPTASPVPTKTASPAPATPAPAPIAVVDWAVCHTVGCPHGDEDLYHGYAMAVAFELSHITDRQVSIEVWFDGVYQYTSNFTASSTGYYYDVLPWANYPGELVIDVYAGSEFVGSLDAYVY